MMGALEAGAHPLHLTFTNIDLNTSTGRWQVIIKVFSDDFASSMKLATGYEGELSPRTREKEIRPQLIKWLQSGMSVWFDNREVSIADWDFNGFRIKEDATWISFTFNTAIPVSEVRVKNTIHFDLFPDQKNLLIFTMGTNQYAGEFKARDPEKVFRLSK
jgi:hypothetical protein